jgi:hypothetical protein
MSINNRLINTGGAGGGGGATVDISTATFVQIKYTGNSRKLPYISRCGNYYAYSQLSFATYIKDLPAPYDFDNFVPYSYDVIANASTWDGNWYNTVSPYTREYVSLNGWDGNLGNSHFVFTTNPVSQVTRLTNNDRFGYIDTNLDGTIMYSANGLTIKEYSISNHFPSWNNLVKTSNFSLGQAIRGYDFNSSGTQFFYYAYDNYIYQFSCSTPFDLQTATYDNIRFLVDEYSINPWHFRMKLDDTGFFACGYYGQILEYTF